MTTNDLIKGEIYYAEYDQDRYAIIKAKTKSFNSCLGIYIYKKDDYQSNYFHNNFWSCNENIIIATEKEKAHLLASIKADTFVPEPKEVVINDYLIY